MDSIERIERVMDGLPDSFLPDKAAGIAAVLLFRFTGRENLSWVVRIAEGRCSVERGEVEGATLTLEAPADVYDTILNGKIMASMALSRGKIRLSGDLSLAPRVATWFKLPGGMRLSLL